MDTAQIALDADLVAVLEEVGRPGKDAVRELIVMELYREGLISSGKAAELLGVSRMDFIQCAAQRGVPYFNMSREELGRGIEQAKSLV